MSGIPQDRGRGVCEGMKSNCMHCNEQENRWEWRTVYEQRSAEGGLGREQDNAQLHMICSNSEEDGLTKANTGGREVLIYLKLLTRYDRGLS